MELNEIYKLVREWYHDRLEEETTSSGICIIIEYLEAQGTLDAWDSLMFFTHFEKQKPNRNRHPEFFNEKNFKGGTYWWDNEKKQESDDSRLRFLDKMIEITKIEPYEELT